MNKVVLLQEPSFLCDLYYVFYLRFNFKATFKEPFFYKLIKLLVRLLAAHVSQYFPYVGIGQRNINNFNRAHFFIMDERFDCIFCATSGLFIE